jgi:hypothetical protein
MKFNTIIDDLFTDEWTQRFFDRYHTSGLSVEQIVKLADEWDYRAAKYLFWMRAEGFTYSQVSRGVKKAIGLANFDLARFPVVP